MMNQKIRRALPALLNLVPIFFVSYVALRPLYLSMQGGGSILNSSLGVTNDGLDWITQGAALSAGVSQEWPLQRSPGFVLVNSVDYVFGQQGIFVGAMLSIAVSTQFIFAILILRAIWNKNILILWSLFIFAALPLHVFSTYVLSDSIAIALVIGSFYFGFRSLEGKDVHLLWSASVLFGLLGSFFQNYGFGVVLVLFVVGVYLQWQWGFRVHLIRLAITVTGIVMFVVLSELWDQIIPNESSPSQFSLLKITLDMLPFYVNTWGSLFLPLFFGMAIAWASSSALGLKNAKIGSQHDTLIFSLVATTTGFATVTFFYQWQDSRFTYITGVFATLLFIVTVGHIIVNSEPKTRPLITVASLSGLIFAWFFVPPADHWRPNQANIIYGAHWNLRDNLYSGRHAWVLEARELQRGGEILDVEYFSEKFGVSSYPAKVGIFGVNNNLYVTSVPNE